MWNLLFTDNSRIQPTQPPNNSTVHPSPSLLKWCCAPSFLLPQRRAIFTPPPCSQRLEIAALCTMAFIVSYSLLFPTNFTWPSLIQRVTDHFVNLIVQPGPQSHLWMLLPLPQATGHSAHPGTGQPPVCSAFRTFAQTLQSNHRAIGLLSASMSHQFSARPLQMGSSSFLKRSQSICKYHPF